MGEVLGFIWCAIAGLFRSRVALQAEILVLRHQLNVLRRRSPKRVVLGNIDRLLFCGLYRLSATVLDALKIVQPETVIRWHRAGFRAYPRWSFTRSSFEHVLEGMSQAKPTAPRPGIFHGHSSRGVDKYTGPAWPGAGDICGSWRGARGPSALRQGRA